MPQQRTITLSYANHRQQAVVRIEFAWDAELAAQVKPFDVRAGDKPCGAGMYSNNSLMCTPLPHDHAWIPHVSV